MARPLPTGKQSVNLAAPGKASSRIRRDPPPPPKKAPLLDPDERDRLDTAVGIVLFALAIAVIVIAAATYAGWSPSEYTMEWRSDD